MNDELFERRLRSLERDDAHPTATFSEALYERLAGDFGYRGRRGLAQRLGLPPLLGMPTVRIALIALLLLVLLGGVLAGASRLLPRPSGVGCVPGGMQAVVDALSRVPGYTYAVSGTVDARREGEGSSIPGPLSGQPVAVAIEGAYAAPDMVREVHVAESTDVAGSGEYRRIGDEAWTVRSTETEERWYPSVWMETATLPLLAQVARNPLLDALGARTRQPLALSWREGASDLADPGLGGACIAVGERVWSEAAGSKVRVTAWIDPATALPRRLLMEWLGFIGASNARHDRRLDYRVDYPATAPVIVRSPGVPAGGSPRPTVAATAVLRVPGSGVVRQDGRDVIRVTLQEVREAAGFAGSSALPGNSFVAARLRVEILGPGVDSAGEHQWQLLAPDGRPSLLSGPPFRAIGGPEPWLGTRVSPPPGHVMEGWLVVEAADVGPVRLVWQGDGEDFLHPQVELRLRGG